jgi:hypothetical protein
VGRAVNPPKEPLSDELEAKMKVLIATSVGLALLGVTGANAQDYPYPYVAPPQFGAPYQPPPVGVAPAIAAPAPAVDEYNYGGLYMAAPVGVAPAPIGVAPPPYGSAYIPGPYPGSYVVDAYTGRWCTFQPDGWHWCWTP